MRLQVFQRTKSFRYIRMIYSYWLCEKMKRKPKKERKLVW